MLPEEFEQKMKQIYLDCKEDEDIEVHHGEADDLMCDLLRFLGYEEGVKWFEQMICWYA